MKDLKMLVQATLLVCLAVFGALAGIRGTIAVAGLLETGTGQYEGTLYDVKYEGIMFKSCEVKFKTNSESSSNEQCSTKDKDQCNILKSMLGQSVKVEYRELLGQPLTLGSGCIIEKVTVNQEYIEIIESKE